MAITYSDTPDADTDENTLQLASLTPTNKAVIIGNGSAWTAGLGATIEVIATGSSTARTLADWTANVTGTVATQTALATADRWPGATVMVLGRTAAGDGGDGVFRWVSGNQSALVTSDPQKFVYVPPASDLTGTSGVWSRVCDTADIRLDWGGAGAGADDSSVFKAAWSFLLKQGGGVCTLSGKTYRWASAQEFAYLVRNGSAGSQTGYQGAGDGNNQATNAGVNISYSGGVTFRGQGSGTFDSIFNDDGATIIDFDVNLALRTVSVTNLRFERMAMRNVANLSSAGSKVIHITSYDTPVITSYQVHFREVSFLDDSYEEEGATTGIADAFVVLENTKVATFVDCSAYKQGNWVRLGGEASDHPDTYLEGEANATVFQNCQIAGDIVYINHRQTLFDNCEWWPLDPQTTAAASVSGVGAIIKPSGTGFFDTMTLLNCKASYDGNDTRTFLETVSGQDGGTINVIGGIYGDYDVLFEHNGDGNLNLAGCKLRQLGAGQTDIVLGATFAGQLFDGSESLFTHANLGTHLEDNRTSGAPNSLTARDYTRALGIPRVVYANGVKVDSTNTTSEEVLRTITIPGAMLGPYGFVEIDLCFSMTNSGNNKTPRLRIGVAGAGTGGTAIWAPTVTTVQSYRAIINAQNRNSESSQIMHSSATPVGSTNSPATAATINTANDWEIVISSQKATGSEDLDLEYVRVSVLRRDTP